MSVGIFVLLLHLFALLLEVYSTSNQNDETFYLNSNEHKGNYGSSSSEENSESEEYFTASDFHDQANKQISESKVLTPTGKIIEVETLNQNSHKKVAPPEELYRKEIDYRKNKQQRKNKSLRRRISKERLQEWAELITIENRLSILEQSILHLQLNNAATKDSDNDILPQSGSINYNPPQQDIQNVATSPPPPMSTNAPPTNPGSYSENPVQTTQFHVQWNQIEQPSRNELANQNGNTGSGSYAPESLSYLSYADKNTQGSTSINTFPPWIPSLPQVPQGVLVPNIPELHIPAF